LRPVENGLRTTVPSAGRARAFAAETIDIEDTFLLREITVPFNAKNIAYIKIRIYI